MKTRGHSGARNWIWFAAGGGGLLLIGIYLYHFVTARELSTYFYRLKPGMSYAEVTNLIPRGMIHSGKEPCTSVLQGTFLVRSNALPAYKVSCSGPAEPLLGIEDGVLYFDQQDRLVGARYGASGAGAGGFWKPNWGERHQ